MSPVKALLLSYLFVFAIIFLATVIQKIFKLSPEFSRKMIHIGVGNWVYIALFLFNDWLWAVIPPVTFILINSLSYRYKIFKAMELDEKNPGTIYYAVSLTILTWLVFYSKPAHSMAYLGIVAMTWGDGMAAVIGQKWPVRLLKKGKSLGGTVAFVVFSTIASIIFLKLHSSFLFEKIFFISICVSLVGALIELLTPRKIDNLTVPLIAGIGAYLFI